jgi:hypothetical protein
MIRRRWPLVGLLIAWCLVAGCGADDGGETAATTTTELTLDASPLASTVIGTAGLLGAIGIVVVTYTAATRAAEQYLRDRPADDPGDRPEWQFMHSLVPILIGYTIAHYLSLMVFQGQMAMSWPPTRSTRAGTCSAPPPGR